MTRKTLQNMGDGIVAKTIRIPIVEETPEAVPGHAQIYAKAGVVHFQDDDGVEHTILDSGAQQDATETAAGTAATGVTAVEEGDAVHHRTTLTVSTTLAAIAGGANLALGKLMYTFPAGRILLRTASMSLAVQHTEDNITADTPDGGLGSELASGVQALLSGVGATAEDIITGQTFNDCDGTPEVASAVLDNIIEAADPHTVYFNIADGWAADGDVGAGLAGTISLVWDVLD